MLSVIAAEDAVAAESQCRHFIVPFPYVSDHIHLVVRVSRVLKGDIDSVCEPYHKGGSLSEKQKNKLVEESRTAIAQLGHYRQAFAFGVMPVFRGGKLVLKEAFNEIDLWKMKPHLTDDAVYELQLDTLDKVRWASFFLLRML